MYRCAQYITLQVIRNKTLKLRILPGLLTKSQSWKGIFPTSRATKWNRFISHAKAKVSKHCCIVFLHKGATTEVVLVYHLNARKFLHENAKFTREFCIGMPNSRKFCMGCPILQFMKPFLYIQLYHTTA